MAAIAIQEVDLDGLVDPAFTAASPTGDTVENSDERVFLRIQNASGFQRIVTIDAQRPCNQGFEHDIVVTLATGQEASVGPFDKERFNTSAGLVSLTYDDATGVSIAALRLIKAP